MVKVKQRAMHLHGTDEYLELGKRAREARFCHFIQRTEDQSGWTWEIYDSDRLLCKSVSFRHKTACLKSLRATQRHASTPVIRDDAR